MRLSAPGLPDRSNYGDLSRLQPGLIATLVRQRHDAARAGVHEDFRIGTPSGLYSWAVPKFIPEVENLKRLAVQQPVHQWDYKDFQGRLGHGYGKGLVSKLEESPVVILKNKDGQLMFTRGDHKDAPVYNLIRTKDKNWVLFYGSPNQPLQIRRYPKEHFKSVPVEKIPELIQQGAELSPKIDGAGVLLHLGNNGVRTFGIRSNKEGSKPEYSSLLPGLLSASVPSEIRGKVIRGEVFGQRAGKSIPANELAGLLNAATLKAHNKMQSDGTRLLVAALALNDNGTDDYNQQRLQGVVDKLDSPYVLSLRRYKGKEAQQLMRDLARGNNKLTHEGVVVHQEGKRPVKSKFQEDADVVIRNIFKADTDGDNRAGGFEYSLPGSDKVVGRVGTGFDHAMLRDMLNNPSSYIGRTARIHSQEQYPSGAYRAPGFVAMKAD